MAAVNAVLEAVATLDLEATARLDLGQVLTTGAGASEGPARLCATALETRGVSARFEPLSAFAIEGDLEGLALERSRLVVFSQGLCPNARVALRLARRCAGVTVVTALTPSATAPQGSSGRALAEARDDGAVVVRHPPEDESGLLVRVLGPAAASLVALRLGGLVPPMTLAMRHQETARRATAHVAEVLPPFLARHAAPGLAFVTVGASRRLAHGLRWKLLEAAGVADPPVWDVLQFAHGPFQQVFERPTLLCALERPGDAPLLDRLERMLVPERHLLLRSRSSLDGPFAFFEHDAFADALALALVGDRDVEIGRWPGHGVDAPLYGFDASEA
jgi:creatinine amidohydrolase